MAQTGKSRQYRSTGKSEYRRSDSRSAYVAGNTVRKLDVVEEICGKEEQGQGRLHESGLCAVFERLPACGGHCFDWIYPSAVGDYRKRKAHCGDGKHAEQPEGIQ